MGFEELKQRQSVMWGTLTWSTTCTQQPRPGSSAPPSISGDKITTVWGVGYRFVP